MFDISNRALSSNLVLFCGMIALLFVIRSNPLFDRRQNRFFIVAIIVNLVALFAISLDYTYSVSGEPSQYWPRRITSFLNFALSPVVPFLLYRIFQKDKMNRLLYLPLVANFLCCFLSIWQNIVYSISTVNTYDRGPLFLLPIITSFFYIAVLFIHPASSHAQKKKKERIFLLAVVAFLCMSMFLEIGAGLFFLSWNVSALCTILYYLQLNIHAFSLDTLTGVSNRQMYNHALDRVHKGPGCIIAMVDINYFKEVNDEYGHDVGDQYLIRFSKLLTRSFAKVATLYRIGGDEFVLISKSLNPDRFSECLERARSEGKEANISFACGVGIFKAGGDVHETLVQADQAMYAEKAIIKAKGR